MMEAFTLVASIAIWVGWCVCAAGALALGGAITIRCISLTLRHYDLTREFLAFVAQRVRDKRGE